MYNALTPLFNHVSTADLFSDFKPEPLGIAGAGPVTKEPVPRAGVTIYRDRFDVPYVYGKTRDDVTWGGQYTGWHIWMDKDLRTILGEPVKGKFAVRYCGGGSLTRCRKLLWDAINQAGNQLAAKQGPDPSHWHSSATAEEISFIPGPLTYKMRYANRPSGIQQVLSFFGHAPGDR